MQRFLSVARTVGGVAVVGGIGIEFFIYDVDAGKRAVIFDKLQGVQQVTIGEGTHFRIPYIQVNEVNPALNLNLSSYRRIYC